MKRRRGGHGGWELLVFNRLILRKVLIFFSDVFTQATGVREEKGEGRWVSEERRRRETNEWESLQSWELQLKKRVFSGGREEWGGARHGCSYCQELGKGYCPTLGQSSRMRSECCLRTCHGRLEWGRKTCAGEGGLRIRFEHGS
jgi:hypothetical protein